MEKRRSKVPQVAQRKRIVSLFYLIIKFLPGFIHSFSFPYVGTFFGKKKKKKVLKAVVDGLLEHMWRVSPSPNTTDFCPLKAVDNGCRGDVPGGIKPLPVGTLLAESLAPGSSSGSQGCCLGEFTCPAPSP